MSDPIALASEFKSILSYLYDFIYLNNFYHNMDYSIYYHEVRKEFVFDFEGIGYTLFLPIFISILITSLIICFHKIRTNEKYKNSFNLFFTLSFFCMLWLETVITIVLYSIPIGISYIKHQDFRFVIKKYKPAFFINVFFTLLLESNLEHFKIHVAYFYVGVSFIVFAVVAFVNNSKSSQ